MTALVQAFSRISTTSNIETDLWRSLALLFGAAVACYFMVASYGLDLSPGFF